MIGKGSGNAPETDAVRHFSELLSWHLERGTRPEGEPDTEGGPWAVKEFAAAVQANDRSVRAWCAGEYLPMGLTAIERELFGENPAYGTFRNELRRRHRVARSGDKNIEGAFEGTTFDSESRAEPGTALSLPAQDTIDLIATEYQKSVALFTIGAGRTVLVAQRDEVLLGFRNLMNRLRFIDETDGQERILVWILDLGRLDFDDPDSRVRFTDVEDLRTRFKALKQFKDSKKVDRWNWLQSRAIIVLHDADSDRPGVSQRPAFDPHHVLFSSIPTRWAGSLEFGQLYGREGLQETNYSIFLNRANGGASTQMELSDRMASPHFELRYFGNALLKSEGEGGLKIRSLRLNSPPGRDYVKALGTVFIAATHVLGLGTALAGLTIDGTEIDPAHPTEKLRHHGFLLLRLEDFMNS
jgi:hypothetical protein